jgi:hypothetical protein
MMRRAGYTDAGPDALDGTFDTWGYGADLAGPAADRLFESALHTSALGLTARLDYVFVRNGAHVVRAQIVGNDWPQHGWPCIYPAQRHSAQALATRLNMPFAPAHACAPSDHAGVVATITLADSLVQEQTPPYHFAHMYTVVAGFLAVVVLIWWAVRQRGNPRWQRVRIPRMRLPRDSA